MEFECFRTGVHTDSRGNSREFTQEDLDFIVSSYNPKHHEAPIVIGHPETNAPAFGWIESLRRSGQTLIAKAVKLVPEFIEAIKQGLFRKRSISLNSDGTLRHIGFLGAVPPAVKGLKDLEFSVEDLASFEFESQPAQEIISGSSQPSGEIPVEDLPDQNIVQPENPQFAPAVQGSGSLQEQPDPVTPITNDPEPIPPQPASAPADAADSIGFSAQEDELRKKVLARIEELCMRQRRTEFDMWLNEKLAFGSVTPAMRSSLVRLMEFISARTFDHDSRSYVYDFAGEKCDPLDILRNFVDALPKLPLLQEVPPPELPPPAAAGSFGSFSVDTVSLELHEKILALAGKENLSYIQALHKINAQ